MLTIHALQITHLSLDYLDGLKVIVNSRGNMPSKPKRPVIPETDAGTSMVSRSAKMNTGKEWLH